MTTCFATACKKALLRRLLSEDDGQDLAEYALLAALIGVASYLTWQLIVNSVGIAYGSVESGTQDLSACTPDPGGAGC